MGHAAPRISSLGQCLFKTFRRWSTQGRFEQMHDRLLTVSEAWTWLDEARILARRLTT